MARILVNGIWYEDLPQSAIYESEYEQVILQKADKLFPSYYLIPFKKVVYSDHDSASADLALIEKQYREWWVVECELGQHSLMSHVIPQVETLASASYGRGEAEYLSRQRGDLKLRRLRDMMKGSQPQVLVVVNEPQNAWVEPLKRFDAQLCVIEMFRSQYNDYLCCVSGTQPHPPRSLVSECFVHQSLQNVLVVDAPAALSIGVGESTRIWLGDKVTEWQRSDVSDAVYLFHKGRQNPLRRGERYVLLAREDGRLELKRKRNPRRNRR